MKRLEFYKEYYEITNRIYADHTLWFAKDRETARKKGQIYISKKERKWDIVIQYISLLVFIFSLVTSNKAYSIFVLLFFGFSLTTDFSIIKIEMLYHIFKQNSPYATLLYHAFLKNADIVMLSMMPQAKKKVSGFVRTNSNKFIVKYHVIFHKEHKRATIIITPFSIRIKSDSYNTVFNDAKLSLEQIFSEISEILLTM